MVNTSGEGIRHHVQLVWMLAIRDLKNRYATSYAGIAWNVGVPVLYALINVVVFSILMNGRMGARYNNIPFALFYFVPFSLWGFFSEVVGRSTSILKEYGYLINKIAFPVWILPLVPVASAILSQAILWIIIGGMMIHFDIPFTESALLYVPIWFMFLLLTLGIAYLVSALALYIPDLSQVIPVITTILFWLTPILYSPTVVEEHGALWVRSVIMTYNPFFYLIEMSRQAVFGTSPVKVKVFAAMALLSAVVFIFGLKFFQKLKSGFADVI
jgi:ABC-type polysaccharide/polyol phosphate export permease